MEPKQDLEQASRLPTQEKGEIISKPLQIPRSTNGSFCFGGRGPLDDALDGPAGGGAGLVACTWVWSGEAEASTGAEPLLPPLADWSAAVWFLVVEAVVLSAQLGLAGHLLENGFDALVVEAVVLSAQLGLAGHCWRLVLTLWWWRLIVHPFQESLL